MDQIENRKASTMKIYCVIRRDKDDFISGLIKFQHKISNTGSISVDNLQWTSYKRITESKMLKPKQFMPLHEFLNEVLPEEASHDAIDVLVNNLINFVRAQQIWVHNKSS